MYAYVTPTFKIDVRDWFVYEGMPEDERVRRIQEDLQDYSVFMPKAEYQALQDVKVVFDDKD